jgi:S-layer protein (TIGR01567 family)
MTVNVEKLPPKDLFLGGERMNRSISAIILGLMLLVLFSACAAAEIRGEITDLGEDTVAWDCEDFAGFYYDLDADICTEQITFTLSNINEDKSSALLSGDSPYGVEYETRTSPKIFEFKPWGTYSVIGFMAEKYFAGYNPGSSLLSSGSTGNNLLSGEQLGKILMDDDTELTVTSGSPLELEEGYELAIRSIDIDGNKVYLELSKDGSVVDNKVISPSKDGATEADKTYYYKKDVGDYKDIVIIAIHFRNAFQGSDQNLATIDGLWQISDTAADVSENTEYDKMNIQTVTADTITMNNKDNDITLSKNKDIRLMGGIGIRTADQDDISAKNPLRYYIYSD